MRKHALLIGVEEYEHELVDRVLYAARDARALGEALEEHCGFESPRILDGSQGRAVSPVAIAQAFDELGTDIDEDDLFLFYFAGHGAERGEQSFLCMPQTLPQMPDVGSLSWSHVRSLLDGLPCRRKVLLFDACRNAIVASRSPEAGGVQGQVLSRDLKAVVAESSRSEGAATVLLAGTGPGQRAYPHSGARHGAFTHFLLKGLRGDAWVGDQLQLISLAHYVQQQVPRWCRTQPALPGLQVPWYQTPLGLADPFVIGRRSSGVARAQVQAVVERPAPSRIVASAVNSPSRAREILADLSKWDAASGVERLQAANFVHRSTADVTLNRLETFSCGGQTHEVAIFDHAQTGLKFALIPAGEFEMGSPIGELGCFDEDGPAHRVRLTRAFLICCTECTQAAWDRVGGSDARRWRGATLPIENVSWDDATVWCRGAGLRLPTEAEWEYACRAGTTTAYSFGPTEGSLGEYMWHSENGRAQTHAAGTKKPNAFGLFDMHGNVWEWCEDWYTAYSSGSLTDPVGTDPASGFGVVRGGSWDFIARFARSAGRFWLPAGDRYPDLGIRPAMSVTTD